MSCYTRSMDHKRPRLGFLIELSLAFVAFILIAVKAVSP